MPECMFTRRREYTETSEYNQNAQASYVTTCFHIDLRKLERHDTQHAQAQLRFQGKQTKQANSTQGRFQKHCRFELGDDPRKAIPVLKLII